MSWLVFVPARCWAGWFSNQNWTEGFKENCILICLFVSCLCLLVATLPMAGWADPLDCRWWKTIKTWPIHWEQSFAYPGIYKHLKTNIRLFALSITHVMCWIGWYSSIGPLQSTIYAAKILLLYLWQKDLSCQVPAYLTNFTPLPFCYMVTYFHT